jgi:hypothetical protein
MVINPVTRNEATGAFAPQIKFNYSASTAEATEFRLIIETAGTTVNSN